MTWVPVDDDTFLVAKLFRGFSDPTRLAILRRLMHGPARVTDLVDHVGCSQANVSGHLACLRDCGLVDARPEGRAMRYRLDGDHVVAVIRAAEDLLAGQGTHIDLCRNYVAEAQRGRSNETSPATTPEDNRRSPRSCRPPPR